MWRFATAPARSLPLEGKAKKGKEETKIMINFKKLLAGTLSAAMVLGTMALPVFADGETDVYAIGAGQTYETFANALAANDTDLDGVITYKIYGKVVLPDGGIKLGKDGITTINFTKGSEDAELSLEGAGLNLIGFDHEADLKAINYTGLKLSRLNGSWVGDAAHLNQFFTTTIRTNSDGIVTYTDCTFPNGSGSNTYGKTVYNNCIFSNENADTKYNVWIRGGETEINGGTVKGAAGIKLYSDDKTKVFGDTKIDGVNFEDITKKPAIVATQQGKIEIKNSTVSNCEYGLIANESNQGAALADITVDGKAPAYVSSVDGNLYTEIKYADKEAADKGTTAKTIVAMVKDKYYTTLKDAMQAACDLYGDDYDKTTGISTRTEPVTIDLLADIENQEGFYVRGGEKMNTYGSHYAHNIDITLDGHGYKIDTGVYGRENPDVKASPKIGFASLNGKFTVKDVVVPNDLVFDLSKTYDDVLSECSQREGGQACSLTIEGCTFYGSNVAYCGAVDYVTYKNNKFLLTENENNGPDSYPLWYKFNNHIKSFTFEGNTVNAERALNLARFAKDSEIVVSDNNFTVENSENIAKSAAIMLAENHTESSPFNGKVTFSENTVDAHSAVIIYSPSEYNTNFTFAPENNTLVNNTKLVGFNEWSGSYSDENAKKAAEALVNKIASTNAVSVKFNPTADKTVYDIVLSGEGKNINRLTTADLTFKLETEDAITYEIKKVGDMNVTPKADNYNRYLFNFDGVNKADATVTEIVIGQVEFTGYGKFKFGVDNDATANIVNATKTVDNIVTSYVVNGGTTTSEGTLDLGNGIPETELKPETAKLTVNVSFPNAIEDNAVAYQNMKVTVSGNGVNKEFKLGTGDDGVALNNDKYTVNIENELVKNNTYTVTVSGAGYRTARYTVSMTGAKTLNFWNNVKTAPMVIEKDSTGTGVNTNFLAGDIVKDGQINIYDLSAVVSYFGTDNLVSEHPTYAKYDLNRDGVIDSKDVAYVLVSWGK